MLLLLLHHHHHHHNQHRLLLLLTQQVQKPYPSIRAVAVTILKRWFRTTTGYDTNSIYGNNVNSSNTTYLTTRQYYACPQQYSCQDHRYRQQQKLRRHRWYKLLPTTSSSSLHMNGRCCHRQLQWTKAVTSIQHQERNLSITTNDTDHWDFVDEEQTTSAATTTLQPALFRSGPSLQLGIGKCALHTHASVIGTTGNTIILCTVARDVMDMSNNNNTTNNESFLTVEFRQRASAVGQIPSNRIRNDYGRPMTSTEILAARIIDRSLRPLLLKNNNTTNGTDSKNTTTMVPPAHYHIVTAVQAMDIWGNSGHPIATALNAASAALYNQLMEPVAATVLAIMSDGSIIQDPNPSIRQPIKMKEEKASFSSSTPSAKKGEGTQQEEKEIQTEPYCVGELLYAGTRTHVIMMEWTSIHDSLSEDQWSTLLNVAHGTIQPILDTIDEYNLLQQEQISTTKLVDQPDGILSDDDKIEMTAQIRASLGLPPLVVDDDVDEISDVDEEEDEDEVDTEVDVSHQQESINQNELFENALSYCYHQMTMKPIYSLYGVKSIDIPPKKDTISIYNTNATKKGIVTTHRDPDEILSKRYRGRRETIINQEIYRLVDEYLTNEAGYILSSASNNNDVDLDDNDDDNDSNDINDEDGNDAKPGVPISESDRKWLQQKVGYVLLKHGLWETSSLYGTRSDGRRNMHVGQGWKTIRPIQMTVPALPDSVHGSAIFARGDTQVICTVTLGAPREGQPMSDPFQPITNPQLVASEAQEPSTSNNEQEGEVAFDKLPIGSLRFLRTQEALESDLNSRKSLADKERTGDSGNLAEVKRAFLQYDFPAYSTGNVPKRGGMDRRSIGHGALAERAVLPVMPEAYIFPYAVRITSEVTDSNGSSSMASVCGATLALRDAGVPIKAAVAGVSVGLAVPDKEALDVLGNNDGKSFDEDKQYSLLLDITGTEDHYGAMDFKIAGTRKGVTAIQLDVKEPLPTKVLIDALYLAKAGRIAIIDEMDEQCKQAFGGELGRMEPKPLAPRVEVVRFDPQRKRDLVGPGGVVLRQLEDRYDVSLDLTQEGQCLLFGANRDMVEQAKQTVMDLVAEVVEGETYVGTVIEIKDFGAIIELLRNKEGILHVSEISTDPNEASNHPGGNVGFVRQSLKLGQKIELLCIGVDPIQGSVKLSRKALLEKKKQVTTKFATNP